MTWTHVDLEGKPPTVALWRSVRAGGETKTRQSRRTLELPARAAEALRVHRTSQRHVQLAAGDRWQGAGRMVWSSVGTHWTRGTSAARSVGSGRRLGRAGVDAARAAAQPRVVAIEHGDEYRGHLPPGRPRQQPRYRLVYRRELRPVLTRGASAMDALFPHEKPGLR